jgi:hypothetical protein
MPCNDGGVPYPPSEKEVLDRKAVNILCGLLSLMTGAQVNHLFDKVNWREAGVSRAEAMRWWKLHKLEDEERKRIEHERLGEAKRRQEALKSARKKLNHAELEALGIVPDDTHDS